MFANDHLDRIPSALENSAASLGADRMTVIERSGESRDVSAGCGEAESAAVPRRASQDQPIRRRRTSRRAVARPDGIRQATAAKPNAADSPGERRADQVGKKPAVRRAAWQRHSLVANRGRAGPSWRVSAALNRMLRATRDGDANATAIRRRLAGRGLARRHPLPMLAVLPRTACRTRPASRRDGNPTGTCRLRCCEAGVLAIAEAHVCS